MNRNVESHFSTLPDIDIQRSIFDRSSEHMTTFNAGDLIPIYIDEVLPGDTFKMTSSKVVRAQTMLTPVFGNMYLDTYWYFIPMRLVWDHAKEFFGENTQSAWIPQVQYQIPSISSPSGGFATGTIADYLGLPVGVDWSNSAVRRPSALPFRAYAKVCDEWFRDQNVSDPLNIPTGDSNQIGSNGSSYINDVANGGMPFKVAKYHDYFTSCLPSAQKGPAVTLPLGQLAPVVSIADRYISGQGGYSYSLGPTHFRFFDTGTGAGPLSSPAVGGDVSLGDSTTKNLQADNLFADLSLATASTINDLRLAFQLQKFYEKQARGGSRYIEVIRQHFGVSSPDARLQRTEYLGGNRVPIAIHEVTNNAQSSTDFLGDLGAKSVTSDIHEDFERSFTEHGYLLGVCCVRYDHSYPQGLERFWTRNRKLDYYYPVFANLGEQPVYKSEIYYANNSVYGNNDVFGYQEAWAEYRYKPSRVSGEMRPGIDNSLASWHLADYYAGVPSLSDSWIREDTDTVDRVLSVSHENANQVFCDFYVKNIATRPMPMYSIPGLIDHH